jgi:hypothetical protein
MNKENSEIRMIASNKLPRLFCILFTMSLKPNQEVLKVSTLIKYVEDSSEWLFSSSHANYMETSIELKWHLQEQIVKQIKNSVLSIKILT